MTAQNNTPNGKLFTLEDLNPGGENYKAMSPQTKDCWWDGNVLVDANERKQPEAYPKVYSKNHNI